MRRASGPSGSCTEPLAGAFQCGTGAQALGTQSTAVGQNSTAGAAGVSGATAFGFASTASGQNSTALGNGASASAANSVALGAGSVANQANTVSVGAAGAERRITNVAAGVAPTDAVNVSQLGGSITNINNQINNLSSRIDSVAQKAYRGIAGVAALAGPVHFQKPGDTVLSAGAGFYQNETAVALQLSHLGTSGNIVYSAGVASSPEGRGVVGRVGVSIRLF